MSSGSKRNLEGSKGKKVPSKLIVQKEEEEEEETSEDSVSDEDNDEGEDQSGEEGSDDEEESDDEEGSDDDDDDDDDDDFEQQSSDDDDDVDDSEEEIDEDEDEFGEDIPIDELEARAGKLVAKAEVEGASRTWGAVGRQRQVAIEKAKRDGTHSLAAHMHTDDLSSDDEQENENTIGRVPLHWYDAYDHIGYNIHGEKVVKRNTGDSIDKLLSSNDPLASRTVYDMYNDKKIVLSDRDLEIIRRVQAGAFAHPEHNDTPDYVDYYTHEVEQMPLSAAPEPKRRFQPSKWELMKVMSIAKAMKEGRYVSMEEARKKKYEEEQQKSNKGNYLVWNDAEDEIMAESKRHQYHLPAPKMPLPGHAESYNPPQEFLLTEEEKQAYEDMEEKDRPYNFNPTKYSCLRHVPGYENFVKERFERCLDLYLCPRKLKKRLNIDPETLLPRLPKPRDLKPFPTSICIQFIGHKGAVRSISVSPDGQYLVSGGDDGYVRIWETDTGLCRYAWNLNKGPVIQVAWNPIPSHDIIAAAAGKSVVFLTTGFCDLDSKALTEVLLSEMSKAGKKSQEKSNSKQSDEDDEEEGNNSDSDSDSIDSDAEDKKSKSSSNIAKASKWNFFDPKQKVEELFNEAGPKFDLVLNGDVSTMYWHYKGDYLVTLTPLVVKRSVQVHQISKTLTQCPFSKNKDQVQAVQFHPSRPFLFVATKQHVKVFNLIEQKLIKKLLTGCKWISSMDIHSSGDHLIVGSYDRRVVWFDLDLSSKPYKTLKFHEKAVRNVAFHKRYPLMASASDDGNVHIFHAMTYSDYNTSALIVPLKVLRGHGAKGERGVFQTVFHPKQPWIFTSGADGLINLFQDL